MINILLVAFGGAVGSVLRYLTGVWTLRLFGPDFPFGTLAVNIVGSYAIGCVAEALVRGFSAPVDLRLLVMTGLIGGFTTFSAFSLDLWVLYERGEAGLAFVYLAATLVLSLAAAGAGLFTVRAVF